MIAAVAVIPAAPSLLTTLTGPDADDLRAMRGAVAEAVAHVLGCGPTHVFVVARRTNGTLAGFGAPLPTPTTPVSADSGWTHELGEYLLRSAGFSDIVDHVAVPDDAADAARSAGELGARSAATTSIESVLVLADGSATRGPRSPMGDDPAGEVFDSMVGDALRGGTGLAVSEQQARSVGCDGLPGLTYFSVLDLPSGRRADLLYEGAPTGVGYLVALKPCRLP